MFYIGNATLTSELRTIVIISYFCAVAFCTVAFCTVAFVHSVTRFIYV